MLTLSRPRSGSPPLGLALLALAAIVLSWALATLPLHYAALLVAAIIGGLALLRAPQLGLCLLGLSVPFGSLYELSFGGISAGPSELLLIATAAAFALRNLAARSFRPMSTRLWLAFAAYALLVALSLLWGTSLAPALKELAKWIEMLLLFWIAASTLGTEQARYWLIFSLLLGGMLEALLGIYQFLFQVGPEGFVLFGRYMRAYGTFLQPNPYGGYLGLLLPLAYGTVWAVARPALRGRRPALLALLVVASAATLLMAAALVMSWSRGALLGAAGGLALVTLWLVRRSRWVIPVLIAAVLLAAPLAQYLPERYTSRLTGQTAYLGQDLSMVEIDDDNFSTIERLAHWQAAWRMFGQSPWLGVGAGQYAVVYPQVSLPRWQDPLGHAHNYYLNVLAEQGLVGLALYGVLCVAVIVTLWRALAQQKALGLGLGLGALGMWGHLLTHSLVDSLYVHEMYLLMALLIGATLASRPSAPEQAGRVDMETTP